MIIDDLKRVRHCLIDLPAEFEMLDDQEINEMVGLLDGAIAEVISFKEALLNNVGTIEGYKYLIRELEDKLTIARGGK